MEIEYKGANCIVISIKGSKIVVDPKLSLVGLKDLVVKDAVQLATAHDFVVKDSNQRLSIDGPGEYEVADISIKGIPAVRHIDAENDVPKATMYHIDVASARIAVIGHVTARLSEAQVEQLGTVDILVIPIGGSGYTLDSHAAAAIVRRIGPKAVIPTHYNDNALSYEVPQGELEPFVKELAAPHETVAKLKIKNNALPDVLTVYEITRTA